MASVGCDRRILKAFYSQYVAVLLIVLTFCIGAFQRASASAPPAQAVWVAVPAEVGVASAVVDGAFSEDGTLAAEHPRLEAIATLLKSHDLSATAVISVSRSSLEQSAASARTLGLKLEQLEQFLLARGVPRDAMKITVTTDGGDERGVKFTIVRAGEAGNDTQ